MHNHIIPRKQVQNNYLQFKMKEVTFISAPQKHIHHAVNGVFINPYFQLFTGHSFSRTHSCFHIYSLKE